MLLLTCLGLQAQISGRVTNESGQAVSFASVAVYDRLPGQVDSLVLHGGSTTDANGQFVLSELLSGASYLVKVTYLGYKPYEWRLTYDGTIRGKEIKLKTDAVLVDEIEVRDEHPTIENSLSTLHLSQEDIQKNMQGNFAQSLDKIPGLSAINTGISVAKPVIRGLSSNRIIVNEAGITQQGQQWGSDHGLEIDAFSVQEVEVIKGPASLQYGSDGMGGVINILPVSVPAVNKISGELVGLHKTVNGHWGGSAKLAGNSNNVYGCAQATYQSFGDYRVPADSFTYNGFVLPIVGGRLKNTAGEELHTQFMAGILRPGFKTQIQYSRYDMAAGLFSGAVGLPLAYGLQHDGNYRDIDQPSQEVIHHKLTFNQRIYRDKTNWYVDLGYQRNLRTEFAFPDFHSTPDRNSTDNRALALDLQTISANGNMEQTHSTAFKSVLGINTEQQWNTIAGFDYLIPNFRSSRAGLFAIGNYHAFNKPEYLFGLRVDYGHNQTDYHAQQVYNSSGDVTDSLVSIATDKHFFNWSASFGVRWDLGKHALLKLNLGKSFRIPQPAETSSNGIHHGTFRHEQGNPDLVSEQGYQFDLGYELDKPVKTGQLSIMTATYFNYFSNYIYLSPSARFSPLPEAGQLYRYEQNDAVFTGLEAQLEWETNWRIRVNASAEYLFNYNMSTGLALPFTPPASTKLDLAYYLQPAGIVQQLEFGISQAYYFAQNRTDRNEAATPGYYLLGLSASAEIGKGDNPVELSLRCDNLLNAAYLNHLSRYRILDIPEPGRNLQFMLRLPFGGA